jgi:hypothetical protein
MKRRTCAWMAVLAVGVSLGGMTSAAVAADNDVTGTWTWTFMRPNSDDKIEIILKLKQEGEKLTGKISRASGDNETEIKDGSVKDGEVKFKVERERDGNVFTVNYKGKLEGDAIKGKSEFERNGEKQSRDWEAKRKP